jgi:hypothetical protein
MSRNRVEQHPDEYVEDLNPEYEVGENHAPPRYETRPASEIKELHEQCPNLTNDELRQIPVLVEGSRLEQGAKYLDLRHPEQGEFTAMGGMEAGPNNWYVPKSDVDHELWNLLNGVTNPYRLGEHAR